MNYTLNRMNLTWHIHIYIDITSTKANRSKKANLFTPDSTLFFSLKDCLIKSSMTNKNSLRDEMIMLTQEDFFSHRSLNIEMNSNTDSRLRISPVWLITTVSCESFPIAHIHIHISNEIQKTESSSFIIATCSNN